MGRSKQFATTISWAMRYLSRGRTSTRKATCLIRISISQSAEQACWCTKKLDLFLMLCCDQVTYITTHHTAHLQNESTCMLACLHFFITDIEQWFALIGLGFEQIARWEWWKGGLEAICNPNLIRNALFESRSNYHAESDMFDKNSHFPKRGASSMRIKQDLIFSKALYICCDSHHHTSPHITQHISKTKAPAC